MGSSLDLGLLSAELGLLSLAVGSVWAGAFGSLPTRKVKSKVAGAKEEEDEEDSSERLTKGDAWLFPVFGSVVLVGFYLVVKYLGPEWINWLLGWYFSLMGVGSVWQMFLALTHFVLGDVYNKLSRYQCTIQRDNKDMINLAWRTPAIVLFPLATLPSFFFAFSKSALASNLLALSFSYNALSLLKIDSFATGVVLLSGLFFYDVWWVFGTEVMVSVATSLDAPIKLLWPKSITFASENGFALLGLGDIVIPGTFVALSLRYDYHQWKVNGKQGAFKKPYFYGAMAAYTLGLGATMAVMLTFQAAQPALLYLSPACILSFVVVGGMKGQLKEAWLWRDEPAVPSRKDEGEKGSSSLKEE